MTFTGISKKFMPLAWALSLLVVAGGCSSGGSEGAGGGPPAAAPLVGTFVDSPVQGLGYRATPSGLSGLTDANGQFSYLPGDMVTYNVFGRPIGAAVPAAPVVTVLSVFNATSVADPRVLNLSQLLLTLGGIPAGTSPITLPVAPPAGFPLTLNFSASGFDTSFPGLTLVSEATATTHLQTNFATLSVTLAGSGTGGASVTSNPAGMNCGGATCSADFPIGTTVTLTPAGTGFIGWSEGCTGTGTCVVTLNVDTAVTATFTTLPGNANLSVTTAGNGTGTVTSSPAGINCGAICATQFVQGTVNLTANAANGSTFAGWSNATGNASCTGIATSCSVLLTVDSALTATFTLNAVPVLVTANTRLSNGGGGTVQCSADGGVAGPCGSYPVGTAIVLTATPNTVSNFTGWSGAGCSGTGTCTFTLTGNTAVTANFNRPTLTAQLVGNGLISSNPAGINSCLAVCLAPFDKGSLVALTASGDGFTGWSGGNCAGTGSCLVAMDQDITVTATFHTVGLLPFAQQAYLKGATLAAGQEFGKSVALDGDTLAVGAIGDASCATGINGNQANNGCVNAGAVYVFRRIGGIWSQEAYLKASNPDSQDQFGWSVALSGDTLVVGARGEASNAIGVNGDQANNSVFGSGAAYVFTRTGGVWSQEAYLKASNPEGSDQFGYSVALSGDTLVVGAEEEASCATGINGDQANNACAAAGAAYVFTRIGGAWSQEAYLKASNTPLLGGDRFAVTVALSNDMLVVGAYAEDSCATGINGDQANNSCVNAGAVYVFKRIGGIWSQEAYLKASNTGSQDLFGWSVALSNNTLVVGARSERSCATGINGDQANNDCGVAGATYVFTRAGDVWSQEAYLKASNPEVLDAFGWSVALFGDTVVVGAGDESSSSTGVNSNQFLNNAPSSGAAYVFTRAGGVWSQQAYLKASNTGSSDWFGTSVALSGGTVVVGASREDSNATGVNGEQANNSALESGAAYVFVVQ